jgi:hypothetical protein
MANEIKKELIQKKLDLVIQKLMVPPKTRTL